MSWLRHFTLKTAAWYAAAAIAGLAVAFGGLGLWGWDFRIPLSYGGDAVFTQTLIKGMLENGWYLQNPALGLPGIMQMYDYPLADGLSFAIMKLIGVTGVGAAATMNAFYVLGFSLAAMSALFLARRVGVTPVPAFAVAVLYCALPYHFIRGEGHLFLSAYFMVPIGIALTLDLLESSRRSNQASGARTKLWWALAVTGAAALGSTGVYYAFFTCFLLFVVTVVTLMSRRRWTATVPALVVGAVIVAAVIGNVAPSIAYKMQAGANQDGLVRGSVGAEVYALKISAMFMPVQGHRVGPMASLASQYERSRAGLGPAFTGEGSTQPLGLIGTVGLVILLLVLVFAIAVPALQDFTVSHRPLQDLVVLNGALLLLATTGGFGALVAFVLPQIRGYGRASVFIAAFALLTVALVFDALWSRRSRPALRAFAVLVIVMLGLLDQVPVAADRAGLVAQYRQDAEYVRRLDGSFSGASVFQLPYVPFPENPPVVRMVDYDHFRPYLHSSGLKWSYGAMRGRESAEWQQFAAGLPAPKMVSELRGHGFDLLWVDTFGYADSRTSFLAQLRPLLGAPVAVSDDQRWLVFRL